jgi:hypothetical protein
MSDDQIKLVTSKIKALADVRPIAIDDADSIIRAYHLGLQIGDPEKALAAAGLPTGLDANGAPLKDDKSYATETVPPPTEDQREVDPVA